MKKLFLRLAALLPVLAFATPVSAAGGDPEPAMVTVIHGITGQDLGLSPSLPVDVSVNGTCLLEGFEFRDKAGPLSLDPGVYTIVIRLANGDDPCSNDPVITADVPFFEGENATVIAHLDADGNPTASKFVNNDAPLGPYRARVELRHTAAAPAVDIDLEKPFPFFFDALNLTGVANGQGAGDDLLLGVYGFQVRVAGTDNVVLGPAYGFLLPQVTYRVYVVGSAATGSLTLIVEKVF